MFILKYTSKETKLNNFLSISRTCRNSPNTSDFSDVTKGILPAKADYALHTLHRFKLYLFSSEMRVLLMFNQDICHANAKWLKRFSPSYKWAVLKTSTSIDNLSKKGWNSMSVMQLPAPNFSAKVIVSIREALLLHAVWIPCIHQPHALGSAVHYKGGQFKLENATTLSCLLKTLISR